MEFNSELLHFRKLNQSRTITMNGGARGSVVEGSRSICALALSGKLAKR